MAAIAAEIKDRDSFEGWLNERPQATRHQEAVALAHRAAMRVAPALAQSDSSTPSSLASHAAVLKAAFWRHSIAQVAAKNHTTEIALAADNASAAFGFSNSFSAGFDSVVASSAASAAAAASASAFTFAFGSHMASAAIAAAATADFAGHDFGTTARAAAVSDLWEEIRSDARSLEFGTIVSDLLNLPIWRTLPNWWQTQFQIFGHKLNGRDFPNFGFNIWAEWYEAAAFGKPIFGIHSDNIRNALERDIALGSQDGTFNEDFWGRDPAAINADIKRWVEEARARDELERAIAEAPGTSWTATIKGFQLHYAGDTSDADVAATAETAFEHEQLKKVVAKLVQKSASISQRHGWEDFHEPVEEIQNAIDCRSDQLHQRILQIYHAGLRLTTFLDQDTNLRGARGRNSANALEAPESRLLLEAIQYIHPWIGRFPTAKRKDIEAGQVYRKMTEAAIAAHVQLVSQARAVDLISEKDRALLQQLVEFLLKSDLARGIPAEKLQAHGSWTIKQLVYAMALHVAVAIPVEMATDVAKETQTWKATKDFLVTNVQIVEEVIADAPAHVQTIIKTIIQSERDNVPPNGPREAPSAYLEDRKRKGVPPRRG